MLCLPCFSAFATNKDIRCHFGSSTTSKSDLSSYRFSEGSSLFRKSVLHRIRFGNTLRLKAELPNSTVSSLRANDIPGGSDRRPSRSLSAYPDQWMLHHHHHRHRLSNLPLTQMTNAASMDNLSYRPSIITQKTLENITNELIDDPPIVPSPPPPPPISTPILSTSSSTLAVDNNPTLDIVEQTVHHFPDCVYASNSLMAHDNRDQINVNSKNELVVKLADGESESSSILTNDGFNNSPLRIAASNADSACSCQLLWQMERDTDSIDKFKLFFKRDHLNVDWDYVQGSSEV